MTEGERDDRRWLIPPSDVLPSHGGDRPDDNGYPPPPGGFDEPCRGRPLAVLPRPLQDDDILVKGEERIYKRRRHWFALLRDARRSAALVVVGLVAALSPPIGPVLAALLLASVVVLVRWAWGTPRRVLGAVAIALVLGAFLTDLRLVGGAVVGFAVVRMLEAIVEHRCYAFLYLTNRRLVATTGIIQRDVSTMPVARITDTKLRLPWLGSWLMDNGPRWIPGYGRFSVESAGQNQALGDLPFLLDAEFFAEMAVLLATDTSTISDDGT